jgi:hypothetical protein
MCILYVFLQVLCIDWFFVNYFMSLFQNVSKVGVLNSVFDLKCTLVVEWWWSGVNLNNGYQKDMFWKEIGLRVQGLLTILDIKVDIMGGGKPTKVMHDLYDLNS